MHRIRAWFPEIEEETWEKITAWVALMREWNAKVNLVSRKDIDNLETKHLAHCLSVIKFLKLMHGARVLDVGTGGGLPGVIMAICYPQAQFLCVDSVGKKINVVMDLIQRLELKNCDARQCRAETLTREFDFVTGRAVTALPEFIGWIHKLVRKGAKHSLENGLLYWKGGAVEPGIQPTHLFSLQEHFSDPHYTDKFLLHLRQSALTPIAKAASRNHCI